jgi:hypothetical protein
MGITDHAIATGIITPTPLIGCIVWPLPSSESTAQAAGSAAPGSNVPRLTSRAQAPATGGGGPREAARGFSGPGQQNLTARSSPALHTRTSCAQSPSSLAVVLAQSHTPVPISPGLALPSAACRVRPRQSDLRQPTW